MLIHRVVRVPMGVLKNPQFSSALFVSTKGKGVLPLYRLLHTYCRIVFKRRREEHTQYGVHSAFV